MKYLLDYSVKNLSRNKRRTLLTLFAIGLAVLLMIMGNSMFAGIVNDLTLNAVRENGHLILQKKSFTKKERMLPLDEAITDPAALIAGIAKNNDVLFASPRINFGGFFISGDESIASFGIAFDVEKEKKTIRLSDYLVNGSYFTGSGKEMIIGVEIAKVLGVKNAGEVVTLLTRDINGSFTGGKFTVTGIIDLGTVAANKIFYLPLNYAYRMLKNEDQPQKIIIMLKDINRVKAVKSKLMKDKLIIDNQLDIFTVEETGIFKSVFTILRFLVPLIFTFFAIIALLTIANTMMMTVLERTGEIGVLQALGIKNRLVAVSFIFESLSIGLIGSLLGGTVAAVFVYILSRTGIQIGSKVANGMPIPMKAFIYPLFSPALIIQIILLGLFISFLAGVIPALRTLRFKPAQAIRG